MRRASHSIGANVRDAASYLLWSLSRACPPEALAPYAEKMATGLVCVACFDREVGVRRAASAAFQEGVGRLVSQRRNTAHSRACIQRGSRCLARPTSTPSASEGLPLQSLRRLSLCKRISPLPATLRQLGAISLAKLLELEEAADLDDSTQREVGSMYDVADSRSRNSLRSMR